MGTLGTDVGMTVAIFLPKLRSVGAKVELADPVVRPAHGCRPSRRLSSWTLPGGPQLCMSVPGLCLSVFYVKWAFFGCVTHQQCFASLCCVFYVFPCYSRLVSLQSTIHQHSWNSLVITPTTTVDVHFSCLYAGVDGIYFGLNSRQQHPHT